MLFADGLGGLILVGLWLFCIIDVITTPDELMRNLPKMAWLLIVLILPDIGSIAWLVAGRNWNARTPNLPYKGNRGYAGGGNRGYGQGGSRYGAPARPSNPDDDEEFQARLRARAEEQRRRAREARGEDEPT
jgi:hypothetical protein